MPWLDPGDGRVCSLGYELAAWIETYCCHGPGDVQGHPVVLDAEQLRFLVECYRLDPRTGVRVYDEVVYSRPKGRAKSETAGHIGVAEAFGPVRFDGWDADGQPVGRRVRSPLIKCLATEESQAGNTFENIAFIAGEWGPDVHPDVYGGATGVRKYQSATALYLPDGGECVLCTSGAASKDGGKETWACADETHLYVTSELRSMYSTVHRNLGKRKAAEPWLLQTTTMYRLGEDSVAEQALTAWRKGELGPEVYVDHREAKGRVDLKDEAHTLRQLRDVYGPAAEWMDLPKLYRKMRDPRVSPDDATAARYYLNRGLPGADAWIPTDVVERQSVRERPGPGDDRPRPPAVVAPGERICLGFDGSLNDDSTVLRGSRMSDGFLFTVGMWEKPEGMAGIGWEVPRLDVLATIREAFGRYDVLRLYADPHEWRSDVDTLAEEFGAERVFAWETRRDVAMAAALDRLHAALRAGQVWHDGDPRAINHYRNAYVAMRGKLRLVRKERPQSPRKIDTVVTDALALEARADALLAPPPKVKGKRPSTAVYSWR